MKKRIRVIVNDIPFYVSGQAIARGVGDSTKVNQAVQKCYFELLKANVNDGTTVGVGFSDMDGYRVQIDYV